MLATFLPPWPSGGNITVNLIVYYKTPSSTVTNPDWQCPCCSDTPGRYDIDPHAVLVAFSFLLLLYTMKNLLIKASLLIAGLIVAVILSEILLAFFYPQKIRQTSAVRINSLGYRGGEIYGSGLL
jgi:hypothetical protein